MPIIGSSSIMGGGSSFTGDTGPKGPTGNTGTPGSIKGGTGSTAIYIERVISDKQNNTITFYTSDGNITTLSGFSGPSGFVNGVEGISAAINPNYFSLFNNVVNGMTLNFKGICAGNNVSITANSEKITVNLNSPSGSYSTSPKENYVVFSNNSTLDSTEIFVNNNDVLNFGLTGIPPSTATNKLYTLLKEDINFVNSISPSSNGGIVLNLKNNSNHWLQTPMGITSFAGISLSGVRFLLRVLMYGIFLKIYILTEQNKVFKTMDF
jgi:hypothetical protein